MSNHWLQPHEYPRRILLVVIGKTPQIVTETLYKLALNAQQPAFVPTEIHLITTQEGAHSARLALLGVESGQGKFHQFCDDYGFDAIHFNSDTIHVIEDTEGQFLDDNQSTEHNRVASDFITRQIQLLTEDENSAVHVSLAGGRKTMSFYAGYALSLYGRQQDRLSHVLVDLAFQSHKDFFYPRPTAECLTIDNQFYSTDEANIILSDIPYVRMRYHVPEKLLQGQAGFQETVDTIQRFMQPEQVVFNLNEPSLTLNGETLSLSPAEFTFYLWMCQRKKQAEPPLVLKADSFMEDYLAVYQSMVGKDSGRFEKVETISLEGDIDQQVGWFQARNSKIKRCIMDALGERFAPRFLIQTLEYEGAVAYQVGLSSDKIEILPMTR